jgi:hypothetical protein
MANRKTAPIRGLRVRFITPCITCGQYVDDQDQHQHAASGDMVCTACALRGTPVVTIHPAALTTAQAAYEGGPQ